MTEEKPDVDPILRAVLDDREFDFFWAFAGEWAAFRQGSPNNVAEFLANLKGLASQYGVQLPPPKQDTDKTTAAIVPKAPAQESQPEASKLPLDRREPALPAQTATQQSGLAPEACAKASQPQKPRQTPAHDACTKAAPNPQAEPDARPKVPTIPSSSQVPPPAVFRNLAHPTAQHTEVVKPHPAPQSKGNECNPGSQPAIVQHTRSSQTPPLNSSSRTHLVERPHGSQTPPLNSGSHAPLVERPHTSRTPPVNTGSCTPLGKHAHTSQTPHVEQARSSSPAHVEQHRGSCPPHIERSAGSRPPQLNQKDVSPPRQSNPPPHASGVSSQTVAAGTYSQTHVPFEDVNDDSDAYEPSESEQKAPLKRKRRPEVETSAISKKKKLEGGGAELREQDEMDIDSDQDPEHNNPPDSGKSDAKKKRDKPIPTQHVYVVPCNQCVETQSVCRVQYKVGKRGVACYMCAHKRTKCEGKSKESQVAAVLKSEKIDTEVMPEPANFKLKDKVPQARVPRKKKARDENEDKGTDVPSQGKSINFSIYD